MRLLSLWLTLLCASTVAGATLDPAFLKASGWDLRDHAGSGAVVHLRGTNLGGWLVQEGWMCPSRTSNPADGDLLQDQVERQLITRFGAATARSLVNAYQDAWITTRDLDAIQAMGMNMVRVPFSHHLFMDEQAPSVRLANVVWRPDAEAFARLDWIISQAGSRGIYVMLDFHQVEGRAIDPWANPGTFWNTAAYQDRAVEIWKRIAARYVGNPWVVGYDLLNEPWSTAVDYYDRCYKAIRAIDPDHTIFVETWGWDNLPVLASKGWSNVVCSLHFYPEGSGATLTNAITDYGNMLRAIRDTQQGSGKYVPINIGEFFIHNATGAQWRQMFAMFNELGVSWNRWTWKTTVVDGWGAYQRATDAADPLDAATWTPDLFAASANAIATAWSRWVTPAHAAGDWSHLDILNRTYTASPVCVDDAITTPASGTLVITPATLLANDSDLSPACDLVVELVGGPAHGTLTAISGGWVYVPAPGYSGSDAFTYRAIDRTLSIAAARAATVAITVPVATDDPAPYAQADAYTASLNATLRVAASGVLLNDGDFQSRTLSAEVVTSPGHGTLALAADGSFTYQPAAGWTGTDTFTYRVRAGGIASAPAAVAIAVAAPPPVNGGGLLGGYAAGSSFPTPAATRTDAGIDSTWNGSAAPISGVPATNFCVRWTGWLCPPVSGSYTLTVTSDDAVRVYLAGSSTPTIDDWTAHAPRDRSATVTFTGGTPVRIRMDFVQYGGGAVARLAWTPPAATAAVIPAAYLVPGTATPVFPDPDTTPPATPAAPTVGGTTAAPTLSGTTEANAVVRIYVVGNATPIRTVTANASGAWTWTVTGLAAGSHTLYVTATDVANNTSGNSPSTVVTVQAAPAVPTAPTSLGGSAITSTGLTLTWTDTANNETGFVVEGYAGTVVNWVQFGTPAANATTLVLTGLTPSRAYHFRVYARNAVGNSGYSNVVAATTLVDNTSPVVTAGQSASGTVGTAFGYRVQASNAPTGFSATGLPTGLTISRSGNITGNPTVAGTFTVGITATNAAGSGTGTITITIASSAVAPVVTANQSATGTVGTAFSYQVLASNTPTGFTATGLPAGLTISTSGLITGNPTAAGTFTVGITASNAAGSGTGTITITISAAANAAPVVSVASATPATVTARTTALSATATDDAGEPALSYTWSSSGPAAVSFSANGTNAAKACTATFASAGAYTLTVTATDAGGLSATRTVSVTVSQTLSSIVLTPASATVALNGSVQFSAAGRDQFDQSMSAGTVTWSLATGSVGSLSTSGRYTAPASAGSATVQASAGGRTGSATVTVAGGAGTLAFAENTVSVGESAGTCTLSVSRTSGSVGAVSVNWATSTTGATAAAGSDYTAASGTLNWADGDTATKTISFPILPDTAVEPAEVVRVVLSSVAGGAQLGSATTAYVTILDDDATALAAPWSSQDLGSVLATGSASQSGDIITLAGSGADVWGTADACRFAAQTITGDFDLVARVDSQTRTHGWAKAGLMVRASTAAGAMQASCIVTPSNGSVMQWRAATNGSSASLAGPNVAAPTWLKLSRRSTALTGYQSADGTTWTLISSQTVALPSAALVGLAVTSHADGQMSVAQFSQVLLTPMASN